MTGRGDGFSWQNWPVFFEGTIWLKLCRICLLHSSWFRWSHLQVWAETMELRLSRRTIQEYVLVIVSGVQGIVCSAGSLVSRRGPGSPGLLLCGELHLLAPFLYDEF